MGDGQTEAAGEEDEFSSEVRARATALREAAVVPMDSLALAEYEMVDWSDLVLSVLMRVLSPSSAAGAPGSGLGGAFLGGSRLEGGSVSRTGRDLGPAGRVFNLSI